MREKWKAVFQLQLWRKQEYGKDGKWEGYILSLYIQDLVNHLFISLISLSEIIKIFQF